MYLVGDWDIIRRGICRPVSNLKSEARPRKLLAINFGGLGDEVLFLPTLQSIKRTHPSWHITLLTEPRARSISQVTDLIDDNISFDIKKRPLKPLDYFNLVKMLRGGKYEIVVSSGSSPQVAALLFLSGIPTRVGYSTNSAARLLLTNGVRLSQDQHATLMYHDLVKGLGINEEAKAPTAKVDPVAKARMKELLDASTAGGADHLLRVLIHPGTSQLALQKGIIKTWSPDEWTGLIKRLLERTDTQVIVAGGPDDAETISDIENRLKAANALPNERLVMAYGKTGSLTELVGLIDLCDLMVCVDSAPMHLAVALSKRLVALFGPTDPKKLLWPNEKFIALRDEEMARRLGGADIFKQPREMLSQLPAAYVQIPLDTVYQTVEDQLRQASTQGSFPESR